LHVFDSFSLYLILYFLYVFKQCCTNIYNVIVLLCLQIFHSVSAIILDCYILLYARVDICLRFVFHFILSPLAVSNLFLYFITKYLYIVSAFIIFVRFLMFPKRLLFHFFLKVTNHRLWRFFIWKINVGNNIRMFVWFNSAPIQFRSYDTESGKMIIANLKCYKLSIKPPNF
jgi:hypothetical protein